MNVDDALAIVADDDPNPDGLAVAAHVLALEVGYLRDQLSATTETLHDLNEALAEAFPQIDAVIRDHPAAHLTVVPDT